MTLFGGCRDASPCDEEFRHCEPCVHALNGSDFELLNGHVLVLHAPDVLHVDLFELRCLGEEYAQVTMWVLSEQCRVMIDHECQAFLKHCSGLQTHGSKASYLGKNCILVVKSVVIQGDRPALLLQMTGTSGRRHHNCWSEHDRAQYLHVECVRQRLIELDTDIPAQGIMDSTRHRQVHSPILIGNEVSVGRCRNSGEVDIRACSRSPQ